MELKVKKFVGITCKEKKNEQGEVEVKKIKTPQGGVNSGQISKMAGQRKDRYVRYMSTKKT